MRTYDWGEDDEKDSDDYATDAKQEANESHASAMPPRQPDARPKRGCDFHHKDYDSLRSAALLSEPNSYPEGYIDREERASE